MESKSNVPLVTTDPTLEGGNATCGQQDADQQFRPGSFVSRFENRVPPAFQTRSWHIDDNPEEVSRDEHNLSPAELASKFSTDLRSGLSLAEAKTRRERDGPNALTPPYKTPAFVKFLNQLVSGFAPILWAASLLCFLAWRPLGAVNGGTPDPLNLTLSLVILAVILLQAGFNFYQEYSSDCTMEALTRMLPASCNVCRDGNTVQVNVTELVVGDIVTVAGGEKVPADLRMLTVKDMKIDKSTLNGESEPVRCTVDSTDKNFMQTRNVAFFGTMVTEGQGTGVVVATGDRTVFGEIARLAATQKPQSSTLHEEIRRFANIIVVLSLSTGSAAMLGWACWLRTAHPGFLTFPQQVVNCISLIVAFVPEGMPVAVTVTLSIIAKDMAANNVLVKNLGVVETLGSVSTICSDKTGTLTENKMTVSGLSTKDGSSEQKDLLRVMALCNQARVEGGDGGAIVGNASDTAMLRHCMGKNVDGESPHALRQEWKKLAELPFNSTNKFMLTIHRMPGAAGDKAVFLKGAPERMLERCTTVIRGGREEDLTNEVRAALNAEILEAASRGQRILGCTRRILDGSVYTDTFSFNVEDPNFPMDGFCFVGWVALHDPPRQGVAEAIQRCHSAYIKVAMVTGDMRETGLAIAREVGIIRSRTVDGIQELQRPGVSPDGRALAVTGPELEGLSEEGWERLCQYQEAVFARTTPKQKLKIVAEFQSRGECVAVTGDGVNDAPALRQANCGIAMGSGSEVSKEAADLVILDDRFTNVVLGVEHGRRCFANLKKVIIYLLPAGSFSEMLPVMTCVFMGMPLALSSFLMIVICCLTDVGPSLAMVYEKPEAVLMQVPPRKIGKDHLVTGKLILNAYLFIGLIESSVSYLSFFLFYYVKGIYPSDLLFSFASPDLELAAQGQCCYFYALVVMQFGNAMTSRTCRTPIWRMNPFSGKSRNLRIPLAVLFSFCVVAFTCYLPVMHSVVMTRPLPAMWQPLVFPWLGAFMLVVLNESRKALAEKFPNSVVASSLWS